MSSARPLHEVLADLVGDADAGRAHGDPGAYLAAQGHPDLPPDLVAEAVVSYADTAPVEVAEHLAPFVTTHSAVPTEGTPEDDWFDLLTTAPADDFDADTDPGLDDDLSDDSPWSDDADPAASLDFGTGADPDLDDVIADHRPHDDSLPEPDHDQTPDPQSAWSDLEPEHPSLDALPVDPTTLDTPDDTPDDDSDDDSTDGDALD